MFSLSYPRSFPFFAPVYSRFLKFVYLVCWPQFIHVLTRLPMLTPFYPRFTPFTHVYASLYTFNPVYPNLSTFHPKSSF